MSGSGYSSDEIFLNTRQYLLRGVDKKHREDSDQVFHQIVASYGPPIELYPTWHPLVCNHDPQRPVMLPQIRSGYLGLDHTKYFVNAFITCPYSEEEADQVIKSVDALPKHPRATIEAKRLDTYFYRSEAKPVLVTCEWDFDRDADCADFSIPLKYALALILELELPMWRWSECGEPWESMQPYFLGSPHKKISSHFVSQKDGAQIKRIWKILVATEIWGEVKEPFFHD